MTSLPPLYLINLDRSTERLGRFLHWNGHLENIERVPAVDGAALERSELVRSGYVAEDANCPRGSLGCAMSHIRLWEMAVREDRALTIFEDDVVAAHHFAPAAGQLMSELPADWDFVKWGLTFNLSALIEIAGSQVTLQGDGQAPARDALSLASFQSRRTAVAPIRMLRSFGLFGYSISPRGARLALDSCLPLRNRVLDLGGGMKREAAGIDMSLCDIYARMQAFICLPTLVVHANEGGSVRIALDRNDPAAANQALRR